MKPSNQIERRSLTHEFRVSDPGQPTTIGGYAAVFDSPGDAYYWIEELDPHCFDAVMAANPDCRALFNHNPDHVLGRTTAGTLSLSIDTRGLAYTINPPDTQLANDLIVSMRRKDITGSSFGFVVARDQWTDNADGTLTRRILEIDQLLAVSPVTYPAYGAADSQVRSIPGSIPAEFRSRIEARAEQKSKPVELIKHEDEQRRLNTLTLIALEAAS